MVNTEDGMGEVLHYVGPVTAEGEELLAVLRQRVSGLLVDAAKLEQEDNEELGDPELEEGIAPRLKTVRKGVPRGLGAGR